MYPKSTQSLLNVHRAFWLCLKSVFAFCMVEGIMPPANLHGESTPDFIVRMYIECTFDFIEATNWTCEDLLIDLTFAVGREGSSPTSLRSITGLTSNRG